MAGPPRFSAALSGLLRTCLQLAFGLAWPGPLSLQFAPGSPRFLLPAACARILLAYLPATRARASPIPLLAILPLAVLLLPTFAKFSDDNFELLGFCSALCRGRSPRRSSMRPSIVNTPRSEM